MRLLEKKFFTFLFQIVESLYVIFYARQFQPEYLVLIIVKNGDSKSRTVLNVLIFFIHVQLAMNALCFRFKSIFSRKFENGISIDFEKDKFI